jgi:transcriptional regulator with XRE-family HTH domain
MPARMPPRSPNTNVAAFLGEQLGLLRTAAGYTSHEALAKALRADRSTVTKIETGARPPNDNLLTLWLDTCGATGQLRTALEGLGVLARAREDPARVKVAPWFETEAEAHTLRYWAPVIVPGLVQTEAYARELFAAMSLDDAKVREFLDVRMGRQAVMDRPDAPDITIVLWEPVLHHQIGSRAVMRDQLARLIDVSHRPTITVHVLPSSQGANPGLGGAINLAATDDAPELLLSDGLVEDQLSQDPAVVRKARATFTSVRADALNRPDSRNVLKEAMERWSNLHQAGGNPATAAMAGRTA